MNMNKFQLISFSAVALSALVFSGCSSSTDPNYLAVNRGWAAGDVNAAAAELKKNATPENVANAREPLLWMLDAGLMTGLSGEYGLSLGYLEHASAQISEGFQQGEEKGLTDWAASLVSGKYEAAAQEAIMVPVLQVYGALGMNDRDKALNFVSEIAQVSKSTQEAHQKRILDKMDAATQAREFNFASEDSGELNGGSGSYTPAEEAKTAIDWTAVYPDGDLKLDFDQGSAERVFLNPFAYWLRGALLTYGAESLDDVEAGRKSLEEAIRVCGNGKSEFLAKEFNDFAKIANIPNMKTAREALFKNAPNGVTYVIYEGGQAPKIVGKAADVKVPAVIRTAAVTLIAAIGKLGSAGAVIPDTGKAYLPTVGSRGASPEISVQGSAPETLIDYDATLDQLLREEMVFTASDAVVGVSLEYVKRAVALIGVGMLYENQVKNGNALAVMAAEQALIQTIKWAATPIELDRPDSRSWTFLPRTLSVAKTVTPEDGKIEIAGEKITVPAKKENVNFVRVRKVNRDWPATVQVFSLDSDAAEDVPVTRLGIVSGTVPPPAL